MMPGMMPGMMMNPMMGGMGPMGGMFIMMQMMQMMQMLMMMMGSRQQGGCQCGGGGFPMGPQMGGYMGFDPSLPMNAQMPGMPYQQPYGGYQQPQGGGWQPGPGRGANPNIQVPNFGPNPNRQQIAQQLDAASAKYGIPPEILRAIAYKESRWNPNAVGDNGRSFGMMQIYTSAHPDYNVQRGQQNPGYNIEYAAQMLSGLHARHGNWQTAVMRYNGAGPMAQRYQADVFNNILPNQPWRQWGV